ncbi:MAG: DUF4907 domain-containing protein [Bacteroidota bacterium]|nr:DUF4907 domain-containing protein [Bacteroidota bacterium]
MKLLKFVFPNVVSFVKCTFLVGVLFTTACQPAPEKEIPAAEQNQPAPGFNQYKDANLTVEVFKIDSIDHNGTHGWGYDIMINGEIHIHQPHIPAVMGNNGFSSEEKAQIAGEFVIKKIKNNILPPRVSPEELDSLGVLN